MLVSYSFKKMSLDCVENNIFNATVPSNCVENTFLMQLLDIHENHLEGGE